MVGRLSKMSKQDATARTEELLEKFELTHAADRMVKTYSGGMRRRLGSRGQSHRPPAKILFLDEPTTGLDPTARQGVWDAIRTLVADGTTLLLTTQYLDEADALADRISVIDHGTVIAEGTSDDLKAKVGGERLEVRLVAAHPDATQCPRSARLWSDQDRRRRSSAHRRRSHHSQGLTTWFIHRARPGRRGVDDFEIHRPSLDDVFFTSPVTPRRSRQSTQPRSRGGLT